MKILLQFFKNRFLILIELLAVLSAVSWYLATHDHASAYAIFSSLVCFFSSLCLKIFIKPKIELFVINRDIGRTNARIAINNPEIINAGANNINMHYKLSWNYTFELRNNSSKVAYPIDLEYQNIPESVCITNEFKNEPILAKHIKTFKLKLFKNVELTPAKADEYLRELEKIIISDAKIIFKYKDEQGSIYYTEFIWAERKNILYNHYSLRKLCAWMKKTLTK